MPSQVLSTKRCVRCKQKDTTEFSTCRFCGTRYDAVIQYGKPEKAGFGALLRSWPTLILFLVVASILKGPFLFACTYVFSGGHTMKEVIHEQLAPRSAIR